MNSIGQSFTINFIPHNVIATLTSGDYSHMHAGRIEVRQPRSVVQSTHFLL